MAVTGFKPDSNIAREAQPQPGALESMEVLLPADATTGSSASLNGAKTSDASNQQTQVMLPDLTLDESQPASPSNTEASSSSSSSSSSLAGLDSDSAPAADPAASAPVDAPLPGSAPVDAPSPGSAPVDAPPPGSAPVDAPSPGSAYVDFNSQEGPSAGFDYSSKNVTLNIASGADADAGLNIGMDTAIMEASLRHGDWTVGALPTTMSVESSGPGNPYNTYSDVFDNVRTTAPGIRYSPDDKFSIGMTNDSNNGDGLVPDALEATYTTQLNKDTTLNTAADLSAHLATVNANVDYTRDRLSLYADYLQRGDDSIGSVEGTYKIDKDLSVSARLQSTDKKAAAIRYQASPHIYVQAQVEDGHPSVEGGLQLNF